jgi:hypothetical protein
MMMTMMIIIIAMMMLIDVSIERLNCAAPNHFTINMDFIVVSTCSL